MKFSDEMTIKQIERRDRPARYAEWEMKKVNQAFEAYNRYIRTGKQEDIDKVHEIWDDIVARYVREGHADDITIKKQKAFWDKLGRLQYNKDTGASITAPSARQFQRGQQAREILDASE